MLSNFRTRPGEYLKHCIAEVVGTFFLVVAALMSPPSMTFALVGATLLVMVVALGKVSGAHLNPAVTVGLTAARQFSPPDAALYIVSQVIGAFLALGLGTALNRRLPEADPGSTAVWFEMLGTFLLVFVVTRVVISKFSPGASALAIGTSLAVGIAIAGPSSGGVLNPAIATALLVGGLVQGSVAAGALYLAAPIFASVLAGLLGKYLTETDAEPADEERPAPTPAPRVQPRQGKRRN